MIGRLALVALVESTLVVFELPLALVPQLGLVFSILAGLVAKRDEDLVFALFAGLIVGVFDADPWMLQPLLCLIAAALAALIRRKVMPGRLRGILPVGAAILSVVVVIDLLLRLSLPSLNFESEAVLGTLARFPATGLAIWLFGAVVRNREMVGNLR